MPKNEEDQPSARPFWSGTITFGLVSVPVALFPANRGSRVSLHMYSPTGVRLRRRYYSPETGEDLDSADIVRGYEIERGKYVVVTDDELERLAPESSRDIDLRRFVPYADIPKSYFNRAYFLAPSGGSPKAYRLLATAMEERGRAGIATFVMRGKQYLVAIVAERGLLRAETLRFSDEIRTPADVGLAEKENVPRKTVREFEQAIQMMKADQLPREQLSDAESQRLLDLIHKKEKADEDVAGPRKGKQPKVVDLLEVLQQALRKAGAKRSEESAAESEDNELEGASKTALYQRAKDLDIPGRSSMNKDQLIQAIRERAA